MVFKLYMESYFNTITIGWKEGEFATKHEVHKDTNFIVGLYVYESRLKKIEESEMYKLINTKVANKFNQEVTFRVEKYYIGDIKKW